MIQGKILSSIKSNIG